MVGMHLAGHLARRGFEAMTTTTSQNDIHVEQLKKAAQLYEDSPDAQIEPYEAIPLLITALAFIALFISVRYTLGEVVSTLVMIEQPTTTIVERTTHVVSDDEYDADALLDKEEKERLIDEEVIIVKQDPITSSMRKTMDLLHSVGGSTARWRGLGAAMSYHISHNIAIAFMCSFLGPAPIVRAVAHVAASMILCRVHMVWTHVMISKPSPKPWFRRHSGDKTDWKTLMLPSAVYATAQILTVGLPVLTFVVFTSGVASPEGQTLAAIVSAVLMLALSILILLPASVTLTRIEASFLPADEDTIVSFDRTLNGAKTAAISLDGTPTPASGKSLFIEAWRSFDMSCRLRLVKFYLKMAAAQFMIIVVGVHVMMAELYMLGLERLGIFAQAASAQLRLSGMGIAQD